jgi:hypothetical protein
MRASDALQGCNYGQFFPETLHLTQSLAAQARIVKMRLAHNPRSQDNGDSLPGAKPLHKELS